MSRVQALLKLQKRAFETSRWHSLKAALDGVDDTLFRWTPGRHQGFPWMDGSICDIIYHVTGDKLVQLSAALGDGSLTWDTLRTPKGDRMTMLRELAGAQEQVAAALRDQTDETLGSMVGTWGGKRMKLEEFFIMLIEHDLYHAGQIRYIRNIAG